MFQFSIIGAALLGRLACAALLGRLARAAPSLGEHALHEPLALVALGLLGGETNAEGYRLTAIILWLGVSGSSKPRGFPRGEALPGGTSATCGSGTLGPIRRVGSASPCDG